MQRPLKSTITYSLPKGMANKANEVKNPCRADCVNNLKLKSADTIPG